MESIWDFVNTVDLADVHDVLSRQIEYNSAISEEGLRGDGIVTKGADATIRNVGRLGKDGMKETNDEIISITVSNC